MKIFNAADYVSRKRLIIKFIHSPVTQIKSIAFDNWRFFEMRTKTKQTIDTLSMKIINLTLPLATVKGNELGWFSDYAYVRPLGNFCIVISLMFLCFIAALMTFTSVFELARSVRDISAHPLWYFLTKIHMISCSDRNKIVWKRKCAPWLEQSARTIWLFPQFYE